MGTECVSWQVVSSKTRNKTKTQQPKSAAKPKVEKEVKFQVHLNHFHDVEEVPFDILVDVPAENCINCLGPRHFKCDKPQNHDYCFNCGRNGVRVNTCPRCCRAYPKYLERRKKAGFGRDARKNKVDEIQTKLVEPILKVSSTTTIVAETRSDPVLPVDKGSYLWSSAVKFSSFPPLPNSTKISLDSPPRNAPLTNNSFSLCNENMTQRETSFIFTDEYLKDLANLLGRIKNLPISDQDRIVLQFISERRKSVDKKKLTA